jgi:hypothetical protein
LSGIKGVFTAALESEVEFELEELEPLIEQMPEHITEQAQSELLLELAMGLLSGTKGGSVVCTSALEVAPGPIEGPSSSFGSIGGTYDEDSDDAASTSSERVMFCMITDGTSSSGRFAISAKLITIPSSTSLI